VFILYEIWLTLGCRTWGGDLGNPNCGASQGTVVVEEWKIWVTALVESRWEVYWWESCSVGTLLGESLVKSLGESLQELAPNVESPNDNAHGESLGELLGK
jgi:hypothetical protein